MKKLLLLTAVIFLQPLAWGASERHAAGRSPAGAAAGVEAYGKKTIRTLNSWSAQFNAWEARSEQLGVRARQALDKQLASLGRAYSDARNSVDSLRVKTAQSSKRLNSGATKAVDDLRHMVRDTASRTRL